jgi:hypothetical protein
MKKNYFFVLIILFLFGCKKTSSVPPSNNELVLPNRPALGSLNYGGVVFYVLKPGDIGYDPKVWHGLVFANTSITSKLWGCYDVLIPNANSTSLGYGKWNTSIISDNCPGLPYAASYCQNLVVNGYDDWYLPTKDELQILYDQRMWQKSSPFVSFPTNHPYATSSQIDSKTFHSIRFDNVTSPWSAQLKSSPHYAYAIPIRSF